VLGRPAQTAVPAPIAPPDANVAVGLATYEPTAQDWADYRAWCREQDLRDRDMMDAHREMEYQDMLDAGL